MHKSVKRTSKHRKGGNASPAPVAPQGPAYSDAASYMLKTVGSGDQQWNNVFSQSSSSASNGNGIVGLQGQKAGGKRKASKKQRGGFWTRLINQAAVPLSLLGLAHTMGKRKSSSRGGKTRKNRKH